MEVTIRQFTVTTVTPNLPMYRAYQRATWLTTTGAEDDWFPLTSMQNTIDQAYSAAIDQYHTLATAIQNAYETAVSAHNNGHTLPTGR